ncbi:MAG: hypothetical protein JWN41_394 [Thermoleophilia bacterium]|nr:hypothetical protein [Thermoleophilia bacterium]
MRIEPTLPQFDYVTIRRTGGIMGVDQTLHVDRELDASVTDRHFGDRAFNLDAYMSQELMAALSTLIARNPTASTRVGCDLFHYDIEVASGGTVHRFSSVDLGADEALHGVMLAANDLMSHQLAPAKSMTLHAVAPPAGVAR